MDDYKKALEKFKNERIKFNIVFLDPPYSNDVINDILNYLYKNKLLKRDAIVICEYQKGEIESLEEKYNNILNDPNTSKAEKEEAEKKLKELENKHVVEQEKKPPTIVTESISGVDPTLINHIKAHEGFRENIYVENFAGKPNPTVGYGFLVSALTADELALNGGKAEPMSKEVAEKILTLKVSKLIKNMDKYGKLGEVYKKAPQQIKNFLVDFAYSIGPAGANGFPRMLAAIEKGDYQKILDQSDNIEKLLDSIFGKGSFQGPVSKTVMASLKSTVQSQKFNNMKTNLGKTVGRLRLILKNLKKAQYNLKNPEEIKKYKQAY